MESRLRATRAGSIDRCLNLPASSDVWLEGATELAGSWWPDWHRWVAALDKATVPARQPGAGGLKAIEPAPGSYVRVVATD